MHGTDSCISKNARGRVQPGSRQDGHAFRLIVFELLGCSELLLRDIKSLGGKASDSEHFVIICLEVRVRGHSKSRNEEMK